MDDELDETLKPENKANEPEKKEESKVDIEALTKKLKEEIGERIRKEEKDKLYPSIEKHKEDAKTEKAAREEAEKKLKEYEDKNLSAGEQTNLKLTEYGDEITRLKEQITEIVNSADSKITVLQLQLVKKDVLAEYGDEIIAELVSGNTPEELAESAKKAHEKYMNITSQAIASAKVETKKIPIGTDLNPSNDGLKTSVTKADINKVTDPKEWEKLKTKLLGELSS